MSASAVMDPNIEGPKFPNSTSTPSFVRKSTSVSHLSSSVSTPISPPKRPATPSEYLSSPIKHPPNAHPYAIHSSSTSILTRSNHSPSKPIDPVRYRPTRSMSSISAVVDPKLVSESKPLSEENQGRADPSGSDMRGRRGLVKSSSVSSFTSQLETKTQGPPDLPLNVKSWSPSDLVTYLSWTLSNQVGTDDMVLPSRLVEDIKSYLLRHRISGRSFLQFNRESSLAASQPPPFLPLLLSLSRKLKRASIKGELFVTADSKAKSTSGHREEASVFLEDDEEEDENAMNEGETSGVRKLAKTWEAFGQVSTEGVHDHEVQGGARRLDPQSTGSSTASAAWERWGLRRQYTGSTVSTASTGLPDQNDETTATDDRSSPAGVASSIGDAAQPSPQPPYVTPIIPESVASLALSVEPEAPQSGEDDQSCFPQLTAEDHVRAQLESYNTLRAAQPRCSSQSNGTLGLGSGATCADPVAEEVSEYDNTGTARRVTLRPTHSDQSTHITSIFSDSAPDGDHDTDPDFGPRPTPRSDLELERQLEAIQRRLTKLERLVAERYAHLGSAAMPLSSLTTTLTEAFEDALVQAEKWIESLKAGRANVDLDEMISMPSIFLMAGISVGLVAGLTVARLGRR